MRIKHWNNKIARVTTGHLLSQCSGKLILLKRNQKFLEQNIWSLVSFNCLVCGCPGIHVSFYSSHHRTQQDILIHLQQPQIPCLSLASHSKMTDPQEWLILSEFLFSSCFSCRKHLFCRGLFCHWSSFATQIPLVSLAGKRRARRHTRAWIWTEASKKQTSSLFPGHK